jgi:arylsulfatase A-like enzyme
VLDRGGEAALRVELLRPEADEASEVVASLRRRFPAPPGPGPVFHEDLPLRVRAGQRLRFRLEPATGSFFLAEPRIVRPDPAAEAVILVLFDTTRADAIGPYGCPDPSTPYLSEIFRGAWKSDRAYAPASWTVPSVASLLTGRVPAVHEGRDGTPLGIAPGIETMAADFARAGWATGAFVANPTVHAGNGFAAGFDNFFVTPYEPASIALPAPHTTRPVPDWIAAHAGEPLFLFLLLLDPHDPYTPPDRPRGSTPFDPGYRGPIVGDEIHRLQIGAMASPPPSDVRHLKALYHDEVRYADAELGRIWKGLEPARRSAATLIFVSDHGEEFGEHGGWKHGPSLHEEILRVPLLIRPGAGRRFPPVPADALVSLLDVLPTLEELVGLARPARSLDGMSLLRPEAWSRPALPPITMLTGGPARAVVVRRASKLFFFDRLGRRGIPEARADPDGHRLAMRLPGLLPALGRFDLAADPGETRPLPIDPPTFAEDWRALEQAIGGTRRGLELRFLSAAPGGRLTVEVRGFPENASIEPFALEQGDRFSWNRAVSGRSLSARLELDGDVDGFGIEGAERGDLEVRSSGQKGCLTVVPGPARVEAGAAVTIPRAAIRDHPPRFELKDGCAGLFVWRSPGRRAAPAEPDPDEAWKKLRALGYIH